MTGALEQHIRERAYLIWIDHGKVEGLAHDHWVAAERDILSDSAPREDAVPVPKKVRVPRAKAAAPVEVKTSATKTSAAKTSAAKTSAAKTSAAKPETKTGKPKGAKLAKTVTNKTITAKAPRAARAKDQPGAGASA